jgi:hypothetical protein
MPPRPEENTEIDYLTAATSNKQQATSNKHLATSNNNQQQR